MKQIELIKSPRKEHGGSLTHKKRKTYKPLNTKKIIHLVLKSNRKILFTNKEYIQSTIYKQADKAGVKIHTLSIQHDHIHHSLFVPDKKSYNQFIRSITGLFSRKFGRGLWKHRPYTRIVEWGRDAKNLENYIYKNELEIKGMIPYRR